MKASRSVKASSEEWSKAGSFMRKPDKGWLHSDQAIKEGGVCYALKYLGCIEVLRSMRTLQYDIRQHVTKEAMYRCCEANGYKFSKRKKPSKDVVKLLADHPRTTHSGRFISLTVSVSGIKLAEMSTGELITQHDMQGISFASGGEKDCPDIVGYVAKDMQNRRACHVLDCPRSLSYDVINTIGQAFELRYKMFLRDPPQLLTPPKRFDAVFEEDDGAYDEPKGMGDVFEESDAYDIINDDKIMNSDDDDDSHEYKYPRPQNSPACKMSDYDTPKSTLTSEKNDYFEIEDPNYHNRSLEFSVGTHFDGQQMTTPSYNNPLVSLSAGDDLQSMYDEPSPVANAPANIELDSEHTSNNNWQTFEESPPARPGAPPPFDFDGPVKHFVDNNSYPAHNTLGYALPLPKKPETEVERKTPPPLPKPFAQREADNSDITDPVQYPSVVENDLASNVWFHGPMSRQDAENLLNCDGDFLVRESTTNPGQYVLTGQQNGYPKHLLLVDPAGVVRTRDQAFDSVAHLIRYHKEQKIPIISSGSVLILKQSVIKNGIHPHYDGPCN